MEDRKVFFQALVGVAMDRGAKEKASLVRMFRPMGEFERRRLMGPLTDEQHDARELLEDILCAVHKQKIGDKPELWRLLVEVSNGHYTPIPKHAGRLMRQLRMQRIDLDAKIKAALKK